MDNEKSAVLDFLNGGSEPKDIFTEEPAEAALEGVNDKPLPFHKDPKVQKFIQKEIEKAKKDFKPSEVPMAEKTISSEVEDVIGAFTAIIGNDTPEKVKALDALKRTLNGSDERASAKAIERFNQQIRDQEEQIKAQDEAAVDELNNGFEQIEEDYGVNLYANPTLLESFKAYLRKISPKNAQREIREFADIPSAWETFQERNKAQPQSRAKQLAARGLARSADTSNVPPTGRSWKDVDKYLDSLKKTLN